MQGEKQNLHSSQQLDNEHADIQNTDVDCNVHCLPRTENKTENGHEERLTGKTRKQTYLLNFAYYNGRRKWEQNKSKLKNKTDKKLQKFKDKTLT